MSDTLKMIISIIAAAIIVGVNIFLLVAFPAHFFAGIITVAFVILIILLILGISSFIYDWLS